MVVATLCCASSARFLSTICADEPTVGKYGRKSSRLLLYSLFQTRLLTSINIVSLGQRSAGLEAAQRQPMQKSGAKPCKKVKPRFRLANALSSCTGVDRLQFSSAYCRRSSSVDRLLHTQKVHWRSTSNPTGIANIDISAATRFDTLRVANAQQAAPPLVYPTSF